MHHPSRLDVRWPALLLLSLYAPWLAAQEAPGRRAAVKVRPKIQAVSAEEERPSGQAVERWSQLKSRYRSEEATVAESPKAPIPRRNQKAAPVRPIPDDVPDELSADDELLEDSAWLDEEPQRDVRAVKSSPATVTDEPLPISDADDSPAWIYGTTAEAVEEVDGEAGVVSFEAAEEDDVSEPALPSDAAAAEEEMPEREMIDDPEYTQRGGSRRPRRIYEIEPTYDVNYDKDIRDFARQQAEVYSTRNNVQVDRGAYPPRMFPGLVYQWEPSNFYHYPLYFEDAVLERYGHTYSPCIQPVVSIAKFSGQLIALPYQMTLDPVCCPKYVLGWYRPGECAPKLHYQPPLNAKAAAVEAGVITGLFYAIP